jgi:hypothetical protein
MRRSWIAGLALIAGATPRGVNADVPTYHRDIAPILQRHCQECHRPGQVAPWPLMTYSQARKMAPFLANVTRDRQMPPWHASTTEGGPFRDARVLSDAEISAIADWQKAGAPEGDPKDAPPPRQFESDWPLGTPDLVLKPAEAYKLPGEGPDEFRVFVIPSGLKEGKWIGAVDFRPGNPTVVHHVLAAIDTTGRARKMDEADPGPGYKTFAGFGTGPAGLPFIPTGGLSGWAPGKAPRYLPAGVGRYLPAGSDVLLQVHYHKSGRPETDATSIALYFAKAPVDKLIRGAAVFPPRPGPFRRPDLKIPAGDSSYAINGTFTVPYDAHASAVIPHMHWLGKDFTLIAERPDGSKATLIRVDRWDFNWQDTYEFIDPVALPKGTTVRMVAHFDNSADNLANPSDPPVDVKWGEQTTDEMCIGFLQLTRDDEHLGNKPPARLAAPANLGQRGD